VIPDTPAEAARKFVTVDGCGCVVIGGVPMEPRGDYSGRPAAVATDVREAVRDLLERVLEQAGLLPGAGQ
jgi:hypothetical protein